LSDAVEHFNLTHRERQARRVRQNALGILVFTIAGELAEFGKYAPGELGPREDSRIDDLLAANHALERFRQIVRFNIFGEEGRRSGTNRFEKPLVIDMHRQDNHLHRWMLLLQDTRDVETGDAGQLHVDQGQTGTMNIGFADRLVTVGGFRDHGEGTALVDQSAESLPEKRMIIDDEDTLF